MAADGRGDDRRALRASQLARLMYQPTGLFLTPSHCFRLINIALEEGISLPGLGVSKIVLAGEPGGSNERIRARLAEAWRCEIYDHYGSTEVGPIGYQCHAHALGFHLNEDEFVVEVIDPETGQSLPEGVEGELVVTNLGRLGSPLIRYRTGDMVRLSTATCPCGSHHARCLGGILGRRDDMVVVKGTNVFPGTIEAIVREYPEIVEFQCLARLDLDDPELALQVEVLRGEEGVVASLGRDIKDILHLSARVQVVPPGTLPQFEGKAKRFRQTDPARPG